MSYESENDENLINLIDLSNIDLLKKTKLYAGKPATQNGGGENGKI